MAQNPSPMVEHTRAHPRLAEQTPPGRREALDCRVYLLDWQMMDWLTMIAIVP